MQNRSTNRYTLAAIAASFLVAGGAMAADVVTSTAPRVDKEARMKAWTTDKDALQKALGVGQDKAYYRTTLEKMGYAVTSINRETPDNLEYEVVKAGHSYEVQLNFKDGRSTKVDVTTNVWKAPGTKAALRGDKDYKYAYPTAVTPQADTVSDRVRGTAWTTQKDAMEKSLGIGHDRAYYKTALEKMGYRITSVNERDARNLEYEIVKGDTSYEVQVDFDAKTQKSTRVDVSTNMWDSAGTDQAKAGKR